MIDQSSRRPRRVRPGRARKRAIRAQAGRAGVAYSVAARQIEAAGLRPGETLSRYGRTIYPSGCDSHRLRTIRRRERRSFEERVADTRRAAILAEGRARHLTERFPPTRGLDGTGVGPLYHGEARAEQLAMLYVVVAAEAPGLVPGAGELAWIAELGEETALDTACAELDRYARAVVDRDPASLWASIGEALSLGATSTDWRIRQEAVRLTALYRTMLTPHETPLGEPSVVGPPLDGVRQILDAVLIVADDGHAPGTRVRLVTERHRDQTATITRAVWAPSGPPVGYVVRIDGAPTELAAHADDLVVLADQETQAP